MKGLIYTGKKEEAAQLFFDGYNCSQSVVAAFSEDFGIPKDVALKFSEGLGGGVGRMRDMCGAVTGMAIVLSMRYGSADLNDKDNKAKVYALVQQAADKFKEKYSSLYCRDLIGVKRTTPVPDERTAEFYKKRPCAVLVAGAAEILEEMI
ncbi:MAG: C_GCAxxG_C_C family protein [Clostridia bacterium]|nr:C_GCAxxG_C_C family protein [Clostridia bacterium]